MTTTTDTTLPGTDNGHGSSPHGEDREPLTVGEGQDEEAVFTERPMIPVSLLTAHPGNVREDKQADRAFCQSVAAAGILTPLEITTSPDGGYVVVDGNVRLDAAVKTGLTEVPYFFSPDTADDAGRQYLHMLLTSRFRTDLTVHEEAAALFNAAEAGMTRTQIRKVTGFQAGEVRAGIKAGGLSPKTRELAREAGYEWNLEELALLAPFEDDADAMDRILSHVGYGQSVQYIVQRITDEREAAARRDKLAADLEASGVTVMDHVPLGAVGLWRLAGTPEDSDGEDGPGGDSQDDDSAAAREMDEAGHAGCPGAVAVLYTRHDEPDYYCLDPERYGHTRLHQALAVPFPSAPPAGQPDGAPDSGRSPDRDRKLVIEGNKAWTASGTVRQRWLADFLSRKAPPSGSASVIARFVTAQIITMPQPLRQALGDIRGHGIYRELGGPSADAAETASMPRLWLLALAPIAAAYEDQMTGTGEQRATWRKDRYSPCPHADAGAWLRFTAELGHQLSPAEQAVADDVPYRGDNPPPLAEDPGLAGLTEDSQDDLDAGAGESPEHASEPDGGNISAAEADEPAEDSDPGSPALAA